MHFICLYINLVIIISVRCLSAPSLKLVANGQAVKLQCPADKRSGDLILVKWYKDGKEFCRYYPELPRNQKLIYLKTTRKHLKNIFCEETNVNLGEVSSFYTGLYTCQVFATVSKKPRIVTRSVSLMVYPTSGPVITGILPSYREGDVIQANCTSAPSNPPPTLIWYINGVMADAWSMFSHPCSMTSDGLCVLRLGLKLQVSKRYFPRGMASFVCEATILSLPSRRVFANTKLKGYNSGSKEFASGQLISKILSLYYIYLLNSMMNYE